MPDNYPLPVRVSSRPYQVLASILNFLALSSFAFVQYRRSK